MAEDRMAVIETVRKAIAEGDVDFLREGMRALAHPVMKAEVSELTGTGQGRARPGATADQSERISRATLGHPGGHPRAVHPARPRRLLLPFAPGAPPAGRASPPGSSNPTRPRPGSSCGAWWTVSRRASRPSRSYSLVPRTTCWCTSVLAEQDDEWPDAGACRGRCRTDGATSGPRRWPRSTPSSSTRRWARHC